MSLLNPAVLNAVTQGQNPSLTGNLANPLCRQARPKVAHSPVGMQAVNLPSCKNRILAVNLR